MPAGCMDGGRQAGAAQLHTKQLVPQGRRRRSRSNYFQRFECSGAAASRKRARGKKLRSRKWSGGRCQQLSYK